MLALLSALACITYHGDPFAEQGGMCNVLMDGPPRRCSGPDCVTVRCAPDGIFHCPANTTTIGNPITISYSDLEALRRRCDDGGGNWEEASTCDCPVEGIDDAVFIVCMETFPPG